MKRTRAGATRRRQDGQPLHDRAHLAQHAKTPRLDGMTPLGTASIGDH